MILSKRACVVDENGNRYVSVAKANSLYGSKARALIHISIQEKSHLCECIPRVEYKFSLIICKLSQTNTFPSQTVMRRAPSSSVRAVQASSFLPSCSQMCIVIAGHQFVALMRLHQNSLGDFTSRFSLRYSWFPNFKENFSTNYYKLTD